MPELPEVETVVRGLRQAVLGQTISHVSVNAPPSSVLVSKSFGSCSFSNALKDKKLLAVDRRGKNILISLSGSAVLWVHLKMTGHFHYLSTSVPPDKHDLVIFNFRSSNGRKAGRNLRFNDYRRFGRLRLFYENELWQQDGLKDLGPEPLRVTADELISLCRSTRRMIKPALLDQSFLAGLGNIYADEALYAARIHPKQLTSSVSARKLEDLHRHIQRLLRAGITNMGTSVDTFSGVNGNPGEFQKYLKVYGNKGSLCPRCKRLIVRQKIGSRSAHFCPGCQRPPRSCLTPGG